MKIFRNRAPLAIAAASLLALTACEESSTGSQLAAEGTVEFAYEGSENGQFQATGRFDRLRPDQGTFAVGGRGELEDGTDALVVYAHLVREDGLFDEFLLSVEEPEVGEFTCSEESPTCSFGSFFFVGADENGDSEAIYASYAGTLRITSINEDRVRGEFTFDLDGFDLLETPNVVTMTSGTFDVPIVQNVD